MSGLHRWVDPVMFELVDRDARYVARRSRLHVYQDVALERLGPSYCARCGVPCSADADSCAADTDRELLIGGDLSSRKKRKVVAQISSVMSEDPLVRRIDDLPSTPRWSQATAKNGPFL